MRFTIPLLGGLALAIAAPAFAQSETDPPKPVTASGSAVLVTDYRFRGLTQNDEDIALQATINVTHKSGFYVGTFISDIDGSGKTPALRGYGGAEVDLYAGYGKTFANGVGVDGGLLYYYYPGAIDGLDTDFFEPYASLTYTIGPVAAKVGAAYAWAGQSGLDFTAGSDDNIYAFGEASVGIPNLPITVKGHLGYTNGSLGLVNLSGKDSYYDWSVTAEATKGPAKVGVSYVDTDITNFGGFSQRLGRGSTVVGYIGLSF